MSGHRSFITVPAPAHSQQFINNENKCPEKAGQLDNLINCIDSEYFNCRKGRTHAVIFGVKQNANIYSHMQIMIKPCSLYKSCDYSLFLYVFGVCKGVDGLWIGVQFFSIMLEILLRLPSFCCCLLGKVDE